MLTRAGIPARTWTCARHARRRRLCACRLCPGLLRVVRPSSVLQSTSHTYNFLFTRKADVRPLTWGYKFLREIARRMPHFRGEPPVVHPEFAPGGPASVVAHAEGPVPLDAPRIVYSEEDERALEEFARAQGM
jgi:alcohol oxidase